MLLSHRFGVYLWSFEDCFLVLFSECLTPLNSNLASAKNSLDSAIKYTEYDFTALNNSVLKSEYKIMRIGNVAIANLYVSNLPTITQDGWTNIASMPIAARRNVVFDAYIVSSLGTSPVTRDGLLNSNIIQIYLTTADSGKRFRIAIPFVVA